MTRKPKPRTFSWLWLLLLSLPAVVGYAESRDAPAATTVISNRSAKSDRLPLAHQPTWERLSCVTSGPGGDAGVCRVFRHAD